jgi:peptide/nickel transport system substrate-binding protein
MDPHASTTWNTFRILFHVFEGFVDEDLTRNDLPNPPIVPALAESWEISPDGKVYTFKLRRGVKFHDGTPWNADAAKFNLDRMTNANFKYYQPVAKGLMRWVWLDLDSYEVVDEYTFRINLKQPNIEFLRRLAGGGSGTPRMVSPTAVMKYGNDGVETHPIGTGPYKFVERVVGEKVVLERNDEYWNKRRLPKTKRLIVRGIQELATREAALLSGEVDVIATPSPHSTPYLESQGIKVVTGPVPTIYILWVNLKDPVLSNPKVREALCMAMDRVNFVKYQRNNYARPAYGILNFGGPGYDPNFRDCKYDPQGAKKLLAEAGYPNGFKTRLDASLGGGGDVNRVEDAQWWQRDFAKIGVNMAIDVMDNATFWDVLGAGMRKGSGFMDLGWGETSFAWLDQVIATAAIPPGGFNSGHYENPNIDELLTRARAAPNEQEMVANLHKVQDIIARDHAWLPTYTPIAAYAMQSNISGFVLAPEHWPDFTQMIKQ